MPSSIDCICITKTLKSPRVKFSISDLMFYFTSSDKIKLSKFYESSFFFWYSEFCYFHQYSNTSEYKIKLGTLMTEKFRWQLILLELPEETNNQFECSGYIIKSYLVKICVIRHSTILSYCNNESQEIWRKKRNA